MLPILTIPVNYAPRNVCLDGSGKLDWRSRLVQCEAWPNALIVICRYDGGANRGVTQGTGLGLRPATVNLLKSQ